MNNQSYYRTEDETGCNIADSERYLLVNCAGVCVLCEPFTSHNRNGRQDIYLMYLFQGELEIDLPGGRRVVNAGNAVLFAPGRAYWYRKHGGGELVYYWAHFTGAGAAELLERVGLPMQTEQYAGVHGDIAEAFHSLFGNFVSRDGCFEVAAAAQLAHICVLLRRSIGGEPSVRSACRQDRIRKSLDYLHRHYRDPVTVAELADIEHLSPSRYSAVFRQRTGVSPRDFLIDLRLRMAVELMQRTDLNLKQIARNVGYDDQLYFSRVFKSRFGVSPGRYPAR